MIRRRGRRLGTVGTAILLMSGAVFVSGSGAAAVPSAVRLHFANGAGSFSYGTTVQNLTTGKNSCVINSAQPVMVLSSSGTQSAPGLVPDGIGVKGAPSSGNGSPCGQVSSGEVLKLTPGSALGARLFTGVRLDLEMTGNALVQLTFSHGTTSALYQLQTGTSVTPDQTSEPGYDTVAPYLVSSGPGDQIDACAAASSSGPNNTIFDNCEWTVLPGFSFDHISISTNLGTVALEGSSDFGGDPNYDSLFYVANSPPVANNDTVVTNEDTAVSGNVLTNDTDPDGNPLSATKLTDPAHGSLTFASTGAFTYTPALDYNGSDSFTYSASDGTDSSNATVSITVNAVNDPPVAQSGSVTTPEDTSVNITVATDVDSTQINSSCTGASGGTITDNGDGTITFLPPLNFNGTITLTCTATDDKGATSQGSATITVGVTPVNDPPVATNDTAEVNQNASVNIPVLANDTDVDGDALQATNISAVSPAGSTVVVNPDQTVSYSPPAGYTGAGSFTYQASDGTALSNTATVSVTVFPVMCSTDTVSTSDGGTSGSFTRLSDAFDCKRYTLQASDTDHTVLFEPTGTATVIYRGFVSLGPEPAPGAGGSGVLPLLLRYDPAGGTNYKPVQWCISPQFDSNGVVTSATLPTGETWCIASADTHGVDNGNVETIWQVYGQDDPKFIR
jgi:VCBS repeat-containing protein